MTDIRIMDVTEPDELADELEAFAGDYARRTGDYAKAGSFLASAEWLRHMAEQLAEKEA